ncbi:MAG: methionine--tRNA ligase [bacterium]
MSKNFYITTTLPYVNAEAHMGHALEMVRADVIARYKKLAGFEVFFNTGTDEHGQKIYQKALDNNQTPQEFTDFYANKFKDLLKLLGLTEEDGITRNFIRTTDVSHIKSAQAFWKACDKNGYIYRKNYEVKYCVGCELEKTDSDLIDGKCPDHPNLQLEIRNEENYFFKFSAFGDNLLKFYEKNPNFVVPDFRFNEIRNFVEGGLQDFSVSRLKTKMPWGIEVPGDSDHIMYVWFDALVNYVSAIGWPTDLEKFNKWQVETGGMVQYCGKDNLRQQTAMWQAMLMAAGLPNSKTVVIDGFVTGAGGIKMSKSLGNGINPVDLIQEYGTDAMRYYVCRELSPFEDSPMTLEMFKEAYNANLANGLGNLVSRVMKMAETNLAEPVTVPEKSIPAEYFDLLEKFEIQKATDLIWQKIAEADKMIQDTAPFKLVKTDKEKGIEIIKDLVISLYTIGRMLNPIMPETSKKIKSLVRANKSPETPLFLRKD